MRNIFKFTITFLIGFIIMTLSNYDFNNDFVNRDIKQIESYTSKDAVADYIIKYGQLPDNYITKDKAKDLGWIPSQNNLWEVSDQKSIGGDRFYNRETRLPIAKDRIYFEADIDYKGKERNAKRIVFSNDGLIYYTDDHYNTFSLLFGDE